MSKLKSSVTDRKVVKVDGEFVSVCDSDAYPNDVVISSCKDFSGCRHRLTLDRSHAAGLYLVLAEYLRLHDE